MFGVVQDVWRIKINEWDGTIASTGVHGGIRVTDLETHELLWSIPPQMTRPSPHLEAGGGFLIWDVWQPDDPEEQFMVYRAEERWNGPLPGKARRGNYLPYHVIRHHQATVAFRFKYPYLAA